MTESAPRVLVLAEKIKEQATRLVATLESQNVASPSFSVDALPKLPDSPEIGTSQTEILQCCTELQALVEGPLEFLTRVTSPRMNILVALQAISHFKIATNLKVDEEISFEEIAQRCGMEVDDARRFLRMATTNHIFIEGRKGFIKHTAASRLLAENDLVNNWIGLVCDEMWPVGPKIVPATIKWPGSQEPNETAFALENNGMIHWDALKQDPSKALRFAAGMRFLQLHPAFDVSHLFTSLGWDKEYQGVLVDIGGSTGSIAREFLGRYPNLVCHVQDLPEMIGEGVVEDEFRGRLHFVPQDIFTAQSVRADVYLLRSLLHDWSDKYAIQIIRNLIPGLSKGSKVIVNEVCLPEPNTISFYHAQLLRGYDLSMKQNYNSKERDAEEWEALFQLADKRFALNRIVSLPGSLLSVVEFLWTE
ncbi:sterigmatocystin 8-O-methyltransferase [Periconia macrospinosa]|uniref:Sterigmatocystin 8-O-methyltransferase n=1 Tax=Periconia macrospinosa TaxID=97972 RepID=A0A2V1EC60_9PLEO|nr:sterigmatocystin 8-O-methyltransferase [Periconia macrospinosa]